MAKKVLFIDRDGTIIKETIDEQIDDFDKKILNRLHLQVSENEVGFDTTKQIFIRI